MNISLSGSVNSGGTEISDPSIKNRLIVAATELFAEQGFAGTSVREICTRADASVPMISHYFGSKQGLYDAIIGQFSDTAFDVPLRLIAKPPATRDEFLLRLEMFISETFNALLPLAPIFRIRAREQEGFIGLSQFRAGLNDFLIAAKDAGHIRSTLDVPLVSNIILDRLGNQIVYANSVGDREKTVLNDKEYRDTWITANVDVLIQGLAGN